MVGITLPAESILKGFTLMVMVFFYEKYNKIIYSTLLRSVDLNLWIVFIFLISAYICIWPLLYCLCQFELLQLQDLTTSSDVFFLLFNHEALYFLHRTAAELCEEVLVV